MPQLHELASDQQYLREGDDEDKGAKKKGIA